MCYQFSASPLLSSHFVSNVLFAGNQKAYVYKMSETNGQQRAAHCIFFPPLWIWYYFVYKWFPEGFNLGTGVAFIWTVICSWYVKRTNIITFYGVLCTHLHVIAVEECAPSRCQLYCCQSFKRASCTLHTCIRGIFTVFHVIITFSSSLWKHLSFFCVKTLRIYLHLHSLQ